MPNSHDEILALLRGARPDRLPVFGVLPSLTASGLKRAGVKYSDAHTDARKMADAAASTFEMFGWESAVVPFDICVEAEALGCKIDFQTDGEIFLAPTVVSPIANYQLPRDLSRAGRIPLVADAIGRLKQTVGRDVAVGAWIPGPFTLAWQAFGADEWLSAVGQGRAEKEIERLGGWLVAVGNYYRDAGADFITVHEMGGSPQIIGPEKFRTLVKPTLRNLFARLSPPHILSVCGDTNAVVADLAECNSSAINIDHRNDLARTRSILGRDTIILGNFDPVGVLSRGKPEDIAQAVENIAQADASAIVPGCDLYPDIPDENFRMLMEKAKNWQRHF